MSTSEYHGLVPAGFPLGVIFNKAGDPPEHLREAVEAARAKRIPEDPRGPYCPILGFRDCLPDQIFGPRERTRFQRAAQHNGWLDIFAFFDANPGRTYYCRPALQGENRNGDEPSRWTVVCAMRLPDDTFEQRIANAPHTAVERWRHDPGGENPARGRFEVALPEHGLQSTWVIGRNATGTPVILGMERQP